MPPGADNSPGPAYLPGMDHVATPRQPNGLPSGGQWASQAHADDDVTLAEEGDRWCVWCGEGDLTCEACFNGKDICIECCPCCD